MIQSQLSDNEKRLVEGWTREYPPGADRDSWFSEDGVGQSLDLAWIERCGGPAIRLAAVRGDIASFNGPEQAVCDIAYALGTDPDGYITALRDGPVSLADSMKEAWDV